MAAITKVHLTGDKNIEYKILLNLMSGVCVGSTAKPNNNNNKNKKKIWTKNQADGWITASSGLSYGRVKVQWCYRCWRILYVFDKHVLNHF